MTPATGEVNTKEKKAVHQAQHRSIKKIITSKQTSDGAGVKLNRSIGTPTLDMLDPFLLLDEFRSDNPNDYINGFPDHPHRGFETVTYMLAGRMQHRDNQGNQGDLGPGSVQWMTAGRGIIHSEMPRQENGLMWGLQLWVNLPARDKMKPPLYQDIPAHEIPEVKCKDGSVVRVIAGSAFGTEGVVKAVAVKPLYLDITLPAGGRIEQVVPDDLNAFVYGLAGEVDIGNKPASTLRKGELAVLTGGTVIQAGSSSGARFILVAGKPIREPVIRHGPFVMNTEEEIHEAIEDLQRGRF